MMTRQKSRQSSALKDDSADSFNHSKAAGGADLIGPKSKSLKEFFADELLEENDENNELEEQLENLCDKPKHRVLNKEIGKNIEEMQPLMTMDKELCLMTSDVETEEAVEEEDNDKENDPLEPKDPLSLQPRSRKRKLMENNDVNKGMKLIKTIRTPMYQKFIYHDTWHVIKPWPSETRQYHQCLDFPLVKLANALTSMKLPSSKWSSKVTLYKILPAVLARHTLTIFSGDLKEHNIPERDRQKYQPSCVILRRENTTMQPQTKCFVPFDRIIIFKNQHIFINFEGKLVQLNGAPEMVSSLKDVAKLLDIIDSISLSNPMVEIVKHKKP